MNLPMAKQQVQSTNLERYGMQHHSQTDEAKEAVKATCLEKYGTDNVAKLSTTISKRKSTCLSKYGVDSYSKTLDHLNKMMKTNLIKYGNEHVSKTDNVKAMFHSNYIRSLQTKIGGEYVVLTREEDKILLKHNACGSNLDINRWVLHHRIAVGMQLCESCYPINNNRSNGESQVSNYIKSVYGGPIVYNSRTIIAPRELDFYLPTLNLAIEYNGTYIHADPRFYGINDICCYGKMAKDIWKSDEIKADMCKQNGIKLIVIWEYDWSSNTEAVQSHIMKVISDLH